MKLHHLCVVALGVCLLSLGCGNSQPPGGAPEPDRVTMSAAMTVKRYLKRAAARPENAEANLEIMLESLDSDAQVGGATATALRDAAAALKNAYDGGDEVAVQAAREALAAKANEINPEPLEEDAPE